MPRYYFKVYLIIHPLFADVKYSGEETQYFKVHHERERYRDTSLLHTLSRVVQAGKGRAPAQRCEQ